MALRVEHELHRRRKSMNIAVGLILAAFVVLVLALTVVKVTSGDFEPISAETPRENGQ